jgi:hypothetical protein
MTVSATQAQQPSQNSSTSGTSATSQVHNLAKKVERLNPLPMTATQTQTPTTPCKPKSVVVKQSEIQEQSTLAQVTPKAPVNISNIPQPQKRPRDDAPAPKTPEKKVRTYVLYPPGSPLSTPEAKKKFGPICSPAWHHNASSFDKGVPLNMKQRKTVTNLQGKFAHTFLTVSPVKSNMVTKPDQEGRVRNKKRPSQYLHLHDRETWSANLPNPLIPDSGPGTIGLSGAKARELLLNYWASPQMEPFSQYLTRECTIMWQQNPNNPPDKTVETTGLNFLPPQ